MKTFALISSIYILSLISATISGAQTNSWTVITTAETLHACSIGAMAADMVDLTCGGSLISLHVDSLRMLAKPAESHFWSDVGYGTLIGTGAGIVLGAAAAGSERSSWGIGGGAVMIGGAMFGAIAGGTVGAIVGVASGGDDEYDLSRLTTNERIKTLRDVRRKN